jgi:hypothetical protein
MRAVAFVKDIKDRYNKWNNVIERITLSKPLKLRDKNHKIEIMMHRNSNVYKFQYDDKQELYHFAVDLQSQIPEIEDFRIVHANHIMVLSEKQEDVWNHSDLIVYINNVQQKVTKALSSVHMQIYIREIPAMPQDRIVNSCNPIVMDPIPSKLYVRESSPARHPRFSSPNLWNVGYDDEDDDLCKLRSPLRMSIRINDFFCQLNRITANNYDLLNLQLYDLIEEALQTLVPLDKPFTTNRESSHLFLETKDRGGSHNRIEMNRDSIDKFTFVTFGNYHAFRHLSFVGIVCKADVFTSSDKGKPEVQFLRKVSKESMTRYIYKCPSFEVRLITVNKHDYRC